MTPEPAPEPAGSAEAATEFLFDGFGKIAGRYTTSGLVGRRCVYVDSQIYYTQGADNFRKELSSLWKVNPHNKLSTSPVRDIYIYPSAEGGADPKVPTESTLYSQYQIPEGSLSPLSKIQFGIKYSTKQNYTFYEKRTFPIRIIGKEDKFVTDEQWRAFVVGDKYDGRQYQGIIPNVQISDHYHRAVTPMNEMQLDKYSLDNIKIKYFADFNMTYKEYFSKYEKKINSLREFAIPNYYALLASSKVDTRKNSFDSHKGTVYMDYVTGDDGEATLSVIDVIPAKSERNMTYPLFVYENVPFYRHASLNRMLSDATLTSLFKADSSDPPVLPIYSSTSPGHARTESQKALKSYLDIYSTHVNDAVQANPKIYNHLRNIFFDIDAVNEYLKSNPSKESEAKIFPMNINLNMKVESSNLFVQMLEKSDLDGKFLTGLHLGFAEKSEKFKVRVRNFVRTMESPVEKIDDNGVAYSTFAHNSSRKNMRFLNLFNWWESSYNNPGVSNNLAFMGRTTNSVRLATDTQDRYRFEKTAGHIKFAALLRNFLETDFNLTNRTYLDVLKGVPSYTETVAYRIVKRAAFPEGPNKTTPVLQNFWFMNSKDVDVIDFFDTQVKYGTEYRYDVYAYKVVIGTKYRYKNLKISKRISGGTNLGRTNALGEPIEETCLSFFDAETGEDSPPLGTFDLLSPTALATTFKILGYGPEGIVDSGTGLIDDYFAAPNHVVTSPDLFVADFNVEYEPSVEIVEVPLVAYKGTVLEDLPGRPSIEPFKIENKESTMAFRIRFDDITVKESPRLVTRDDELYRRQYILSHSLPTNTKFTFDSISPITNIEVYRTTIPPLSWSDFNGELHNFLKVEPATSIHLFTEKIQTDTKYYYMFRSVNSHDTPGQCSEAFEVEMVKQGDITYPVVKRYTMPTRDDLAKLTQQPTKSMRRLLRITPSVTQRIINEPIIKQYNNARTAMDYFKLGYNVARPIWDDQRFKFRLISKKTGRKFDINIKYKTNKVLKIPEPDEAMYSGPLPEDLTLAYGSFSDLETRVLEYLVLVRSGEMTMDEARDLLVSEFGITIGS